MEPLRIGLCGLGTVGRAVVALLSANRAAIERRAGRPLEIVRVASRTRRPEVNLSGAEFGTDILALARDPRIDVVVELIGGTSAALDLFEAAIAAGKHIVTANKALLAEHGRTLLPKARAANRAVGFEAAVAGGIPIVKTVREGLAGNRIDWIAGIINGTSNFILTAMTEHGRSFEDALAEAQSLGYAESDPTFDVEGIDAAHKLAILSALAFDVPVDSSNVYCEGIRRVAAEDIEYAAALGYRVKHLGITRRSASGIEMRVHPTMVPVERLLADVDGVMNAIVVHSDAVGSSLYYGPGAGGLPSASAVLADLIDLARGNLPPPLETGKDVRLLAMADVETAYYLRIPAVDQPGVLAKVAQILAENAISIEAVIQREQAIRVEDGRSWVPVIILTHRVKEAAMNRAVAAIQALSEVVAPIMRIRVEPLDDHA